MVRDATARRWISLIWGASDQGHGGFTLGVLRKCFDFVRRHPAPARWAFGLESFGIITFRTQSLPITKSAEAPTRLTTGDVLRAIWPARACVRARCFAQH